MFIQTYSLNKGIKKFGQKSKDAAIKEMKQLHNRTVFEGIKIKDMTPLKRQKSNGKPALPSRKARWKDQGKNMC
jgi:hypothetical protein